MENTYKVPEQNLSNLQQRIDKLARRCKRIGIEPPVMTVGAPVDEKYMKQDEPRIRRYYPVTLVSVERPKIDGYEFIATLGPITDDEGNVLGNILRNVPNASVTPEERFRNAANYCDHCKTDRFRLETFVIFDGTTQRQIGRNCLANYLGLTNPHRLAEIAQMLLDLSDLGEMSEDEGFGCGSSYIRRYPIDAILALASSAIRNYGWLSNKSAREFNNISTSGRVMEWLMSNTDKRKEFEKPLTVEEADIKLAEKTENWLANITDTTNDYMYNLSLLSRASSIDAKNFGLAVSAISAYSRAMEREIRRNARIESDKNSQYIGTIGERMIFDGLLVLFTTSWATNFGITYLYKMKQGDNIVVYFSSRDLGYTQGQTLPKYVARIKAHETREEVRQTIITRGAEATREMSKEEKRAVNKLKKILKTIDYKSETIMARNTLNKLIKEIQTNGFMNLEVGQ